MAVFGLRDRYAESFIMNSFYKDGFVHYGDIVGEGNFGALLAK